MDYATEIDISVDEYCKNVDRCDNEYKGYVIGAMTNAGTYYSWQCSKCDHVNEYEGYGWDDLRAS